MIVEDFTSETDGTVVYREIQVATYAEWITHVFDHPVSEGPWWWHDGRTEWCVPAPITVEFLAKTFAECGKLITRFSPEQVGLGLNYIFSPSCSRIMETLWDSSVPWPVRQRTISSISILYSHCFALHCKTLALGRKTSDSPLDYVCFMWWHEFRYCAPDYCEPDKIEYETLNNECLNVMASALGIDSEACQESALHGLGHMIKYYPKSALGAQIVIDQFMKNTLSTSVKIMDYARQAREGKVQ